MVKVIVLLFVCLALAAFATAKSVSHKGSSQPETNNVIQEHSAMNDQQIFGVDRYGQTYDIVNDGNGNVNYVTINNYCHQIPNRKQLFVQEHSAMNDQQIFGDDCYGQTYNTVNNGNGNIISVTVNNDCHRRPNRKQMFVQEHSAMNDQQIFGDDRYGQTYNTVNNGNGNIINVTVNNYCHRCPNRKQKFVQELACNVGGKGDNNINSVIVKYPQNTENKYHNCPQEHIAMYDQQIFRDNNFKTTCNIVNKGNGNVNNVTIYYYCQQ